MRQNVRQNIRGGAVVWHVLVDRAPVGPLSESELTAWAHGGRLRPHDLVWSPGMPGWTPAQQTQPFAAVFAGRATASPAKMGDDPLLRWLLPVGRSGWAIAAGYLAFFSVLLLPAPFALATGIVSCSRGTRLVGMPSRPAVGLRQQERRTVVLTGTTLGRPGAGPGRPTDAFLRSLVQQRSARL